MTSGKFTFLSIIEQLTSLKDYQQYMAQCEKNYQIKLYRVNTLSKKQAEKYYKDLKQKYQKNIYKVQQTGWHENQRRLFIWFLICVIKFSGKNALKEEQFWQNLSEIFFNKHSKLLKYQYMNILKPIRRVQWTDEEDDLLNESVEKYKPGQWNQIAKDIYFSGISSQFKSPKHCRQRWNNHLNNKINKSPWDQEQDHQLLQLIKENGKKWSKVSKLMGRKRTQHMIKNRYNSLIAHAQTEEKEEWEIVERLLKNYRIEKKNNLQNQKFNFFNSIARLEEEKNIVKVQESAGKNEQIFSNAGPSFINCANIKQNTSDKSITTAIEDKLFGSSSFFFSNDPKSQSSWPQRSIVHTPGQYFFEDSSNLQRRLGDFRFRLESKGSFDKSQIAASMQLLKPARSDISQQYRILSSSTSDLKRVNSNQFNLNDIKEL